MYNQQIYGAAVEMFPTEDILTSDSQGSAGVNKK